MLRNCCVQGQVEHALSNALFCRQKFDVFRFARVSFFGVGYWEICTFSRATTLNLYEGETPHSFRHGGTANSLKQGKSLEETMYLAFMKNVRTAETYSRGLRVLYPSFDWKDVGIGTQPVSIDEETLM